MQKESGTTNNNAIISGKVVSSLTLSHEVYGEGFYKFYIEVERLSETADILPVIVSERLINVGDLEEGINISINGQVRSYNSFVIEDKRNRLILSIFARDISFNDIDPKYPNEIMLNGYICKPPILRTTPFGREICDMLLAVNRSYNKSDYIPLISWGRNARFSSRLSVGENIKIWGRMQSRNYQKRYDSGETEEKVAYEVSVSKIEISDDLDDTE
ncbi:MAG: single-stranded DNA-binding protein [Defluviitaleaceae bacterium]|nr:single-stranded DNA-binding protein [Defluviitaleaceae bacterium]